MKYLGQWVDTLLWIFFYIVFLLFFIAECIQYFKANLLSYLLVSTLLKQGRGKAIQFTLEIGSNGLLGDTKLKVRLFLMDHRIQYACKIQAYLNEKKVCQCPMILTEKLIMFFVPLRVLASEGETAGEATWFCYNFQLMIVFFFYTLQIIAVFYW